MIKPGFSKGDIEKMLKKRLLAVDAAIINKLELVGEEFVNNARKNGQYQDQTGNLRASISYIVFKDGIKRSRGLVDDHSKKLISDLKSKYMTGYVLIVCTGMDYAASVEAKGKDVLTGSSIKAEKDLAKAFKNFRTG